MVTASSGQAANRNGREVMQIIKKMNLNPFIKNSFLSPRLIVWGYLKKIEITLTNLI
jgi:hypothetical protein